MLGRLALPNLLLLICLPARTQNSFGDKFRQARAGDPADAQFALVTTNGQAKFRPGETIPITLQFASSSADRYELDTGNYDRSGRLWSEEFSVDRESEPGAITDPLADYFGSGVLGTIGGGLRTTPALTPAPVRINLYLNTWFRFDRPGRYRLYVRSTRLRRLDLTPHNRIAVTSSILDRDYAARFVLGGGGD